METWRTTGRSIDLSRPAMVMVAAALAAGWAGQRSGDRLFVLVQIALLTVPVIDGLWSAIVATRARVAVTSITGDAVVGQAVHAEVSVTGWRRPIRLRLASASDANWVSAEPPARGTIEAQAPARGVFTNVMVEVLSQAPLGLVGMSYRRMAPLPRAVLVGPAPLASPEAPFPQAGAVPDGDRVGAASGSQVVRGVRDHHPGDPLRLVHWPATARTGRIVVKELEEPHQPRTAMVLVVDLGDCGAPGEEAAGKAAWIATEALRRGYLLVMATVEEQGPVTASVASVLDANRRLARAVPGRPVPPPGSEAITVTVAVGPACGPA
jgi:uncharacterized protein (DUF58 family)